MTVQEHVIRVSANIAGEFFRYASAVPLEKLDWSPLNTGKSVLAMCREIAVTPEWAMLAMGAITPMEPDNQASMASWSTIEVCRQEFDKRFKIWSEYVSIMPESQFSETKWLPFDGGRDFTYLEMLEYPRWNITYHLGQIAYIQILYGDNEMH